MRQIPGVETVAVEWSARVRSSGPESLQLPGVKNVLAVGAGKGGVGKSMVSVLLAYGLRRAGAQVGLMDADVYGPSIPTMTGIAGARPTVANEKIIPTVAAEVKIISIGLMLDPDRPVIWRGPMVHSVVNQFLGQVD